MAVVLITGGTGLVGKALTRALLGRGYDIIILSRDPGRRDEVPGLRYYRWDIKKQEIDKEAISKADHIIHLAGTGVADKRWTKKRKKEIAESRVESSRLLVNSLNTIPNKVRTVVCASAIGWYGPDPVVPNPSPFTETAPSHSGFLGTTCRLWEESIEPVTGQGTRLVKLRTGIVLSRDGGALKAFIKPMKWGIAAVLGSGKQVISWIHIDDLVEMFISAIGKENMSGAYNAVAPNPVSNWELVTVLAKSRKKWFVRIPVPSFLLKLILGEMSVEVLKSATVSCNKLLDTGFRFRYPFIGDALKSLTH